MKELSIEEKAKRYDEAIEKFGVILNLNTVKESGTIFAADVRKILPELKESEDERIRKAIFKALSKKDARDVLISQDVQVSDALAWLERQGEKEHTDKVEPKFKVGDFLVNDYCMGKVIKLTNDAYLLDTEQGIPFSYEHNVHLWTIEDAIDGDVLCYKDEISLYEHSCTRQGTNFGGFVYHCCYDGKRFIMEGFYSLTEQDKMDIHPATKEQRDLLFSKMKEAGYKWDAEKKELKKVDNEEVNGEDYGIDSLWHAQRILEMTLGSVDGYQTDDGILEHKCAISAVKKLYKQKPDWSEEDEVGLGDAMWAIQQARTIAKDENDMGNLWFAEKWLKSLKERYTWKPSNEQIELLENVRKILHTKEAYSKANNLLYDFEELIRTLTKLK